MTATELLALAEKLDNHALGYGGYAIEGQLREAAEVLELVAFSEGEQIEVHKTMNGARVILGWGPMEFHGDTLIDTLRRAREAER